MKLPSLLPIAVAVILSGCTALPHSGPSYSSIKKLETQNAKLDQIYSKITIVGLNQSLELMKGKNNNTFKTGTELLTAKSKYSQQVDRIGKGDSLKIAIMETPPAILFLGGGDSSTPKTGLAELPIVTVDSQGMISLPFVGRLKVLNQTPSQVQQEIADKLSGIANRPQIIVSVLEKRSSNVTIIGDGFSGKMPITAKGERLLDAITMLGSSMYNVKDTMVQIIRDDKIDEIPLSFILSNPKLNVLLQQDDVITLINKPSSFISMGATGASREVKFEAVGINLSQALARIGGIRDNQADARGVFVFRYQNQQTIDKLKNNSLLSAENSNSYIDEKTGNKITVIKTNRSSDELVPVVYQVDLSNANSLFVMKNFEVQNNDIVYVASAPIIELQKFLYAIFSPGIGMINQVNNITD